MASSSTSPLKKLEKQYDVFVNFRGEDVRDVFLSHLHKALSQNEIVAFVDEKLDRGEDISSSLLAIIDKSYISVVIFSENYAYSPWCLDELVKILECNKTMEQMVLPVFYRVDPSHVQNLTGKFGDAIAKHREGPEYLHKVDSWCQALREISEMSGLVSQNIKSDSKLIEEIVGYTSKKLNIVYPSDAYDDGLVGIDSRVKIVESLLCLGSPDVRVVGIWGMGGIGKTTIARQVFDRISVQFTSRCFVANVKERLEKCTFCDLEKEILSHLLEAENSSNRSTLSLFNRRRLSRKKVLIVLDDVDDLVQQVELLIRKHADYGQGSRIIMTSRDRQLLKNFGATIYEVEKLNKSEALCLFCKHAFKQQFPRTGYFELSNMAIAHAQGIPLALRVLGSNLYGKSEEVWVDELELLKCVSDEKIKHILRISYDGLRENEKEIFLAIACMFKGEDKHRVESLLDVPGSKFGISRLVDRSLITITMNQLHMHDLLQKMGKDIVREEKQFGKRGWLWDPKDIYYLFTRAEGTEAIKGISLNMSTAKELNLKPTAFEKMYNLKFLKFYASPSKIKVYLPKGLSFLPEELRLLHWYQFPLKSLPLGSYVENLVELRMCASKLKELCSGVQQLGNLKFVNLSHSKELIRVPDLSKAAKLEFLDLSYCESLVEIPSPKYLSKLTRLHLTKCDSLCTLPSLLDLKSLKEFRASECLKLAEFPEFPYNVEELVLQRTRIEKVPPSIGSLSRLSSLDLSDCTMLESLPDSICNLKSLMDFQITGCVNLKRLPENIGNLESLGGLNAINSGLIELPDSICNLRKLRTLLVGNCANLHSVPEKLGDLESLTALHLGGIRIKGLLSSVNLWRQLTFIKLESCGLSEFPSCLCHSDSSLEYLLIGGNNFESIPDCIKQLSKLLYLSFGQCKRLKYLPSELPSLSKLFNIFGDNCTSLKSASSLFQLDNIVTFAFANCFNLDLGKCNEFVDHLLATPLASRKTIFYPGNELPQTMMYQNNCGYSLTLSSSSKQCERVQFGLCVVIDPKFLDSVWHGVSSIGYTVYIFTNETLKELGYLEVKEFIPPRYEVFYPESSEGFVLHSEHVVFWSERIELPLDNKKTVFEFYALDMENRRNYNAIVKCGVHHHLRFSNVVGEEDEVEEEEKRKTKRLRML